jgi:hexosaminidase
MKMNLFMTNVFAVVLITILAACQKENIDDVPQRVNGVHDIIPLPNRIDFYDNFFLISKSAIISAGNEYLEAANVLVDELSNYGISATVQEEASGADITFVQNSQLSEGNYEIDISENSAIKLFVNSSKDAFYAAQSLRQYFWTSEYNSSEPSLKIQSLELKDQPDNSYRGFHLDVSRHFFPKEFIFEIIDQMALYKLNKLQIHLTDDQGWRVQIDQYPLLTEVGAYREFNQYDNWCIDKATADPDYNFDPSFVNGNTYGGFYTKQDLIDIVSYAQENFIEVIPEIDMPGHMTAAIMAYPWIGGGNVTWGDEFSNPMMVCDEEVMQFAYDVWDEIIEIFPSNTVHIGADEVEKSFWEESEICQTFMDENGWEHVNYIQSWFVDNLTTYLEGKNKKVIAWDDVMVSNDNDIVNSVSSNIDIMYWRSYKPESSVYAAQNGNNIILTPWDWFYLSSDNTDENLINMYNFSETAELNPIVIDKKMGYQACVWTEHIPSEAVFEKYVFPRFQAFAEVAWTKGKNFESFKSRLATHLLYMDNENINYRKPDFMK